MPPTVRELVQITAGRVASDGDGVKLTRLIGGSDLDMVDPFLLLDCFGSDQPLDYIGGFPDHPHRGFETVTYMLAGRMRHKDSEGHEGVVGPGDVQWMTAGRGLVHSEMPEQVEGLMKGFQLWVNLPAEHKMTTPRYQSISASMVPVEAPAPGVRTKVVAGQTDGGTEGPVHTLSGAPLFLDIQLDPKSTFSQTVAQSHRGFLYVIEGAVRVGDSKTALAQEHLGVLGPGERVHLSSDDSPTRVLLVAGQPVDEAVVRYGPFVMNTRQQILEAIQDFQEGRF
jgi:redox-sensitive bicupin YhaK (pirin superfamily)